MGVKHRFVSGKPSTGDASLIQGPAWDDEHVITGIAFTAGTHAEGEVWIDTVGTTPTEVTTIWKQINGVAVAIFTSTR